MGGKVARARTGTRVRYWADPQIFPKTAVFAYDELVTRARQTSFLVPGLTLMVRDERGIAGTPGADGPHEETFLHSGGVVDFVDHLAPDTAGDRHVAPDRARARSPRRCRCSTTAAT